MKWTKVVANLPLKALFHAHFDAGVAYEAMSNLSADHQEAWPRSGKSASRRLPAGRLPEASCADSTCASMVEPWFGKPLRQARPGPTSAWVAGSSPATT